MRLYRLPQQAVRPVRDAPPLFFGLSRLTR
ncbi:hypothetical protein PCA20602_01783 [Pandoraea capi]|uniref:Uncharacterized protein n=1 Tax=Pandoraea capi TaxID=2508286 RepID=A0ABY6VVK0_9BURK|nr:hypothetical protein PCA20602_01783 [Pandoraea capi]